MAQLLPGLLIEGLGLGLATTPITTAAIQQVPDESSGIASATLNVSLDGGSFAGRGGDGGGGGRPLAGRPGPISRRRDRVHDRIAMGFLVNAALAVAAAAGLAIVADPRAEPSRIHRSIEFPMRWRTLR